LVSHLPVQHKETTYDDDNIEVYIMCTDFRSLFHNDAHNLVVGGRNIQPHHLSNANHHRGLVADYLARYIARHWLRKSFPRRRITLKVSQKIPLRGGVGGVQMKKELELEVVGAEDERFQTDIYEATLSLWNRMNRYGRPSVSFTQIEKKAADKHFKQEMTKIGQRMHGSHMPAAAKERLLDRPYCFHIDSLIGRYHVWYTPYMREKRVYSDGIRIVSVPSPYGRYYIAVDDSGLAHRMFGKPSVMVIKSHCVLRLQQRLGLNEDDALAHIIQSLVNNASSISDIGQKNIPFGQNDGSIKAKTADITINSGSEMIHLEKFFMTICYTYYYPEWETQCEQQAQGA
jgi:hypothetical protein